MMPPKVTVIMPSLNVAKYIEVCMESVLNQTLQDLEILAIDAGSADGTLEILERFAQKDNRVKVVHSDRKSYGFQMNLGISMATGEYVGVVETDDIIEPDMFETLYTFAVNSQADYVKGIAESFLRVAPEAELLQPIRAFTKNEFGSDEKIEIIPKEMSKIVLKDYFLWTGIYRKTFLEGIRFNETPGAAYQDIGFLLQTYAKAEKRYTLINWFTITGRIILMPQDIIIKCFIILWKSIVMWTDCWKVWAMIGIARVLKSFFGRQIIGL